MTTKELSVLARKLASELCGGPRCIGAEPGPSCLRAEEKRVLTREEKKRGWERRPFDGYDPDHLCLTCRAYWHAELCAQALERLNCIERREAARRE